jgi:molybdopterin converting factor small subunit
LTKKEYDLISIKVKLFASAKQIAAGNDQIILEFTKGNIITLTDLRKRILDIYPKLEQIPFLFAINHKIASEFSNSTTVTEFDEIAVLPPISGG